MRKNKKSMVQEYLDYQDRKFLAEAEFLAKYDPEVETIQNVDGTYTTQRVSPSHRQYVRNFDGTLALRITTGTTTK